MGEVYTGTKFRTLLKDPADIPDALTNELASWCHRLAKLGLAEKDGAGYAGNVSIRSTEGFIITRAGADLAAIGPDGFVEVLQVSRDHKEITTRGAGEPSSESLMHHAVYAARPDVNAIIHGHDFKVLARGDQLGLPVTLSEQPYGTWTLAQEVERILGNHPYVLIRNHGFLSLGDSLKTAWAQVMFCYTRVRT